MSSKVKFYLSMSEDTRFGKAKIIEKYRDAIFLENKDTDTQGYMIKSGSNLLIAFRGTQQTKDWATDINGFHQVIPYGNYDSDIRVHRGFLNAYKSIRGDIHKYISSRRNEIKAIYICGHSLGGALAILCAVDVEYNYPSYHVECYPSGNPKVGNKAFCNSYDKRVPITVRTFMRTDIVPALPPEWVEKFFGQKSYHAGQKNPIGPRNIFIGLINWFQRKFKTDKFLADLSNHSIALYKKYA